MTKTNLAAQIKFTKLLLNQLQVFWKNLFWAKYRRWQGLEMFRQNKTVATMFGENQTQHINTNTSYQLSSTVVEDDDLGLFLKPQDLDTWH